MNATVSIQGGCLCGEVRYAITAPLRHADNCHCSMCRRQHGAAFATYAALEPGAFAWISGEEHTRIYATPGGAGWCFCRTCGSTLAGTRHGVITSIALGTVEGDPGVSPQSHIFVGSRAPWHAIHDHLPQFEERPPAGWTPADNAP